MFILFPFRQCAETQAHEYPEPVARLRGRLDAERESRRRTGRGRCVRIRGDVICGKASVRDAVLRWQNSHNEVRARNGGNRRRLPERRVHRRHRLAAIFAVAVVRWARHGPAALHRLLRRVHRGAIHRIGGQCGGESKQQDRFAEAHTQFKLDRGRGKVKRGANGPLRPTLLQLSVAGTYAKVV